MSTNSSDYGYSGEEGGVRFRSTFSYPMYQQFVADNKTMSGLIAGAPYGRLSVVVNGQADIGAAFIASGNYFQTLGVAANPGRTLLPDDDRANAPPVAVISHKYWRSRFGGDAAIVGKSITLNTTPVTIVGVIESSFTGIQVAVQEPPDVMVPIALDPQLSPPDAKRVIDPTYWWLQVTGRLMPGLTSAHVKANLDTLFQHAARAGLDSHLASLSAEERNTMRNLSRKQIPQLRVDSASRGIYEANTTDTRAVSILSGIVGLVLLIVCANVANLLLSRAANRQKEVSVRVSLGATRTRLMRQFLTESLLLASLGGVLGVALGQWGKTLLPGAPGQATPLDWRVLAFAMGITVVTAVVFGIVPALRTTGVNVNTALKQHSRGVVVSRTMLGRTLLVVQVSISIVLLIGAGLFLRTLQNLRQVEVGFNARNLVLFRVSPQLNGYDEKRATLLYTQLLDRLRAVPGVMSATLSNPALLSGSVNSTSLFVQGRTYTPDRRDDINRLVVAPGFFAAMEIPVVLGRSLTDRDNETAPKAVVINAAAARKYFPNESPLGKHFGPSPETSAQNEIVGVVRDVKYNSVRDEAPPTMYAPYLQARLSAPSFTVRTAGEPMSVVASLREAVRSVDPNLPVTNVSTQMEQIEQRLVQEKLFAQAYAIFGGLALLIASIGLFGLMSYSVARRTNEIGIRMALGAHPHAVRRMVLGESMTLVLVGVALGVAIALAAGRFVASLLFGVAATDVSTIALVMTVMLNVAAVAGYLPARHASLVDPMVALHDE
ncbi:MAG: ABC transporter permease [Vicinamibacterales bacterium]